MGFTPAAQSAMVNAKAYGATGDGTTDDTDALRAALATGRSVFLPDGIYVTGKLTIADEQWLLGAGYGAVVLKLRDGEDDNLIETEGFADLAGSDDPDGPANFGIQGVTLDANAAGQTPGSFLALAMYGLGYNVSRVIVRDGGIHSEWSTDTTPAGSSPFEATISDFKIQEAADGGLYFKGPHDSIISRGQIIRCGTLGSGTAKVPLHFAAGGSSNGSILDAVHVWGATYDYGCVLAGSGLVFSPTCQFEGADVAQVRVNASRQRLAGKYFAGGSNFESAAAFELAAGVNNIDFNAKIEDLEGGIDVSAGGVTGLFGSVRAQYAGATAPPSIIVGGTLDQHSGLEVVSLNPSGVSVGSDFRFPGSIQATNVKTYSFTGSENPDRIDIIPRFLVANGRGLSNGVMQLTFFTPDRDFPTSALTVESRGGGSGATLVRIVLFRAVSSDLLNCIARTANDPTILGANNQLFTRPIVDNGAASPALISSVIVQRGLRYAFGVLGVGWSSTPQVGGASTSFNQANMFPMLSAEIAGQTDVGSTYTSGIDASSTLMWGGLT